jgi:hypothetical protein
MYAIPRGALLERSAKVPKAQAQPGIDKPAAATVEVRTRAGDADPSEKTNSVGVS